MSRDEVADLLGIKPESVRSTLRYFDVHEQRGYDRAEVLDAVARRRGKGWRKGRTDPAPAVEKT